MNEILMSVRHHLLFTSLLCFVTSASDSLLYQNPYTANQAPSKSVQPPRPLTPPVPTVKKPLPPPSPADPSGSTPTQSFAPGNKQTRPPPSVFKNQPLMLNPAHHHLFDPPSLRLRHQIIVQPRGTHPLALAIILLPQLPNVILLFPMRTCHPKYFRQSQIVRCPNKINHRQLSAARSFLLPPPKLRCCIFLILLVWQIRICSLPLSMPTCQ
jgi:hypothetical protein